MCRAETTMLVIFLLTLILLPKTWAASKGLDDFDFDDEEVEKTQNTPSGNPERILQESILRAMQKPALRTQIGEVIPILRAMSAQQRLTLAALVSAQIMAPQHADEQNLAEVASMFSNPGQTIKNVSEQLLLPISMDIAKMFKGIATDAGRSWRSAPSFSKDREMPFRQFPPAHRPPLKSEPYNFTVERISPWKRQNEVRSPNDINRRNGLDEPIEFQPDTIDCDYLTSDICQEVSFYPEAEILGSIQKHLTLMEPFLNDFGAAQEGPDKIKIQRRRDNGNDLGAGEGFMCPSTVKYAKPKRARTTSGLWKYIVNTGDYTQSLRLEICLKSGTSCAFLNDNFRSTCNQVYNYHRLMCWDEKRGLHMDVFKVPSCCSCHVEGYSTKFPPHDFPFADKRREVIPQSQSSSGVKREIPRPNLLGRPDVSGQNIHNGGKRDNFRQSDFPAEIQLNPQQRPNQRPFFPPGKPQETFQQPQIPLQRPNQNFDNPNLPHLNNGRPQYNQIGHQQRQPGFVQQQQQQNPQQISHQNNVELYGGRPINGLTDHLVPPGPPLPLDFERPRPSFDQRKRNATLPRAPGLNVVMEPTLNNKRGTQRFESNVGTTPNHPNRGVKPQDSVSSAENTRTQVRPPDGVFGSKIRGPKPPKSQLFVTPTTIPTTTSAEYENPIRVTPKPPNKNNQKKINYNYHPIIDFFANGQTAPSQPLYTQTPPLENKNPITFKNPQKPTNLVKQVPFHPAQFHQPQNQKQQIVGAHEWTPML